MSLAQSPSIVKNGLVLYLDSSNTKSLVGEPTINLLYTSGNVDWAVYGLTGTISLSTVTTNQVYRITNATASTVSFRIAFNSTKLVNGLSYNLSYKYRFISGGSTFSMTDWCDTSLGNVVNTDFALYKYSSAFGTRATYDSTYCFMDFNISANTVVEFYDIQLEQKQYATPFVAGTRDQIYNLSGNDNTGTLTNYPTYNSSNSGSLVFDGINDFINIPNFKTAFAFNTPFTISAWIKPTNSNSVDVVSCYNAASNDGIWLELATVSNQIRFVSRSLGTGIFDLYSSETIGTNSWKHIVATYDAITAKIYIDGIQSVSTASATTLFPIANTDLNIGRIDASLGRYLAGNIGPVSIYNTALTSTQILQNFNAIRGRYGI